MVWRLCILCLNGYCGTIGRQSIGGLGGRLHVVWMILRGGDGLNGSLHHRRDRKMEDDPARMVVVVQV